MSLPQKFSLKVYRGDRYTQQINFKNSNGSPVDLTNAQILAQVRDGLDINSKLILTFGVVRDDINGSITLTLTPDQTKQLQQGLYFYDIQIADKTELYGDLQLIADVSR